MSDSTSNIPQMTVGQSAKEALVNALVDAASPATVLGVNWTATSGLTLAVLGGNVLISGVVTTLANQTLSLTASQTNYVEFDPTGTGTTSGIRNNTSGWTAGFFPLWSVVCGVSSITSYTDERYWGGPRLPRGVVNMASDANKTLTRAEASIDILEITSTTLTLTRDIILPLIPKQWTVFNNTTGAQSIRFIGATGTGITVANAKRAIIYADGTNIVRVTADQ
jgi:hypothetical protein